MKKLVKAALRYLRGKWVWYINKERLLGYAGLILVFAGMYQVAKWIYKFIIYIISLIF